MWCMLTSNPAVPASFLQAKKSWGRLGSRIVWVVLGLETVAINGDEWKFNRDRNSNMSA